MTRECHVRCCVRPGGKFPGPTRLVGSENGGKASAVLLSLVQSCRNLGINPQTYLEDVLRRIMGHPARKIDELLPDRWLAAKQKNAATHSPDQDGVS